VNDKGHFKLGKLEENPNYILCPPAIKWKEGFNYFGTFIDIIRVPKKDLTTEFKKQYVLEA
jgi:hypothetical protein